MGGHEIIADLRRRGFRLRYYPLDDVLHVAPKHLITPEIADLIRRNKAAITAAMLEDRIVQSEAEVFELAREHFGLDWERGAA